MANPFFLLFLPAVCLHSASLFAQRPATPESFPPSWSLAFECQAYPTGLIPGLRADCHFRNRHSLHVRAGYNLVRHRDLGVHDNEQGGGLGGTLGYRYSFRNGWNGWFLGARTDFWRNRLDWQDKNGSGTVVDSGVSKIIVWQPTAEGGYRFSVGKKGWFVSPSLAFGVELNVKTEGAEVGQGAILLLGCSVGKKL